MLSGLLVTALLFTLPQQSSGVAAALDPKLIRLYVSAPASDGPADGKAQAAAGAPSTSSL